MKGTQKGKFSIAMLKKELERRINRGELLPGDSLPSESALCEEYKLSRPSVRVALAALEEQQLIYKIPGKGSFVNMADESQRSVLRLGLNLNLTDYYRKDFFTQRLAQGVADACFAQGIRLELIDPNSIVGYKDELDGVILTLINESVLKALPDWARNSNFPVLTINLCPSEPFINYISVDNYSGTLRATEYLIQLGHTKIAAIGFSFFEPGEMRKRFMGYADALKEYDLEYDENECLSVGDPANCDAQIREFLERSEATAIMLMTSWFALKILNNLNDLNKNVPRDVSLISFDDIEDYVDYSGPSLTCVRQPLYKMGRMAVEELQRIKNTGDTGTVRKIVEPELVLKASCSAKRKSFDGNRCE